MRLYSKLEKMILKQNSPSEWDKYSNLVSQKPIDVWSYNKPLEKQFEYRHVFNLDQHFTGTELLAKCKEHDVELESLTLEGERDAYDEYHIFVYSLIEVTSYNFAKALADWEENERLVKKQQSRTNEITELEELFNETLENKIKELCE